MKRLARWSGVTVLLILSLLVAEGVLDVLADRVGAVGRMLTPSGGSPRVPDQVLGERGNPHWYDHDTLGFRNALSPVASDTEDIVTLGDSQTYGVGVERDEAWPAVLATKSGLRVYSMAVPGWGPGQGYLLMGDALKLRPKTVIYAFYFGNDFFDVFDLAARRPELRDVMSGPLLDSARLLETTSPIADRVRFLFGQTDTLKQTESNAAPSALREYLSTHSRLYGLLRALRSAVSKETPRPTALLSRNMDRAMERMTEKQRSFIAAYRDSQWKTLLTAPYRNAVVDDRDPRIRAGLRGTEVLLARMDSLCRRQNAEFLVLLIPTKETVFAGRSSGVAKGTPLDSVVTNERRVRQELTGWLSRHVIDYLDLQPVLQASKVQPYFEDADGHPAPAGHAEIAEAVSQRLRRGRGPTAAPMPTGVVRRVRTG